MKYFLQRHRNDGYIVTEENSTQNFNLELLYWILDGNREWVYVTPEGDYLLIWSSWYLKPKAQQFNVSIKDKFVFDEAYRIYYQKRWFDMPKLKIAKSNYDLLVRQWEEISKDMPEYVIFTQYDSGVVDVIGKNELSEQDRVDMKKENEKFLRYQVAWTKYIASFKPERSTEWRSPADDEYEADFKPFFDED